MLLPNQIICYYLLSNLSFLSLNYVPFYDTTNNKHNRTSTSIIYERKPTRFTPSCLGGLFPISSSTQAHTLLVFPLVSTP